MDAKLARAALVMRDFLSDDLPESDMGFGPGARAHLDRFRTFLRAFYTFRLDQYPPPLAEDKGGRWDAEVYQGMRDDFEALYEYLVDDSFSTAKSGLFVAQPGIDALRCVTTFDLLHRYPSLPNPLPLLPRPTFSAETRRSSWLGRQDKLQPDRRLVAQAALAKAANTTKAVAMRNSLVIAYRRFEEDSVSGSRKIRRKDKLSLSDARKLRWILIYAIVQTLRSCTDAPAEVRDAKAAKYSLAVSATHLPPWEQAAYCASSPRPACETGSRVSGEDARFGSEPMTFVSRSLPLLSTSTHAAYEPETLSPQMPLFPRAQATPEVSSRSRAASVMGRWSRPMSLRLGWFRNQSIDDVGEPKKRRFTHLEIVVRGYGNGVRKTPPAQTEVVELRPMTAPCPFPATASASECSTTPSETECSTTTRGSDVSSATTPLSEHLPGSWSPFHDGLPPAARCCTSGADSPACSSIYSTDGPMPAPYLEPLDDAGQTRPDNKTDDDHDDDDLDSNADVDSLDLNMDVPAPLLPRRSSARPLSPTAAAPREIRVELGDLQPSPLRIRKERGRVVVGPDCDDARTSTDGTL
ncbi:hypothetical protein VTK73DRAFT_1740 [Phialemonium thermophilum]|uniref:Uncharacterized protein n=1 Tax=Phialemonium thermophilum TaxID=223376 RepID=A0ABR3VT08_9PEZI